MQSSYLYEHWNNKCCVYGSVFAIGEHSKQRWLSNDIDQFYFGEESIFVNEVLFHSMSNPCESIQTKFNTQIINRKIDKYQVK